MSWRTRAAKAVKDTKFFVVGWLGGNYIAKYFDVCEVKGRSMLPTFDEEDGARVLINKIGHPSNDMQRGRVYTFRNPHDAQKVVIKRVVGMEGDRFHFIKDGKAEIIRVPEGHVWIEGDNLGCSEDSRYYGPIPAGLCIGEAVYQLWPTHKQRRIEVVERPERMHKAPVPLADDETLCDNDNPFAFPPETAEERCGIEWEAADDLNEQDLTAVPPPPPPPAPEAPAAQPADDASLPPAVSVGDALGPPPAAPLETASA
eukprot:TRINITY_DN11715_c0_g1_i1.p1 TRINITY_DN11715_c0_g1~~TRINITY_DN11715_c0_g1_i1.p1  ORF type:complete len:258 (+),score=91.89 TRINITY_DN11715_c0_g1_i1:81-854(+)